MTPGNRPASPEELFDRALGFHQAGNLAEAERLYLLILADQPESFAARHSLGVIRAQQGRGDEALALIGAALAANPDAAPAWTNYGNILGGSGRLEEALESYDRALAIQPDGFDALVNRARTLLDLQRFEDALLAYDRVLAARPDDVEALNERGNILRGLKRFEDALASYDAALAIAPRLAEALVNRGVVLSELRRLPEALASYDAALAVRPLSAAAFNNRGFSLRQSGRLDAALEDYETALRIAPEYPAALNNRAKLLCETGRIAEGFADFTRAAQLACRLPPPRGHMPAHKARHDREQAGYLGIAPLEIQPLRLEGGTRLQTPAINPGNSADAIAASWRASRPNNIVIDNLLTDAALAELRRFCRGSTIWRTIYDDGYLGTFPEQGFACPLLAQIAEELPVSFPAIFDGHPLLYLWAFKYDSRLAGTAVHADEAAVNVNFWITPDDANLDPQSGGLVIWDAKPPPDWDFARYNGEAAPIRDFLAKSGAKASTVPYRANRAVIFDSDLFHKTDTIRFKEGYRNRRINVTLLYGRRRI